MITPRETFSKTYFEDNFGKRLGFGNLSLSIVERPRTTWNGSSRRKYRRTTRYVA
jgi:hypothetical protein